MGVCHFVARMSWQVGPCVRLNVYMHDGIHLLVVWKRQISTCVCVCFSCFLAFLMYVCHFVCMCWCLLYIMWVLVSVCVPVGVAREPQFLYGSICFVLFVLLINEIRGAACWDGPAAPLHWTGPLSHGLTLFSK